MTKAHIRLASERFVPEFGKRGELRQKIGENGRVHIDRWLPFLVLHRSDDPETSIARRVAVNSPAYLIWSPEDDVQAAQAAEAVLGCMRKQLGEVLVIEVTDAPFQQRDQDSPTLMPFEVGLGASEGEHAQKALGALTEAVEKICIDTREAETAFVRVPDALVTDERERLAMIIPQIHRGPAGELYPQLTHDLAVSLVDSLLTAAAAFMRSAGAKAPKHHRSLGRSAFLTAALNADKKLDAIARSFDFLLSVSPINTADAMARFVDSGEDSTPKFHYRPLTVDPDSAKRELYSIDLSILEDPLLERLLCEKRREIDRQLTMLATRNTPSFRPASMLVYGTVSSQLLSDAHAILASVKPKVAKGDKVIAEEVALAANALVDSYRAIDPRFEAQIEIRNDVSGLLVSGNRLMISSNTAMARRRLDALLSHEVSVHLLTYFNGATQGLTIFRTGLAGYEGIQEGLGVFAEWAVGGLTSARMRLLAGRVVAVEAMLDGAQFVDVYRRLTKDHGFGRKTAFDISSRVFRSGGLAKDAIYLKGFREVINRVATGSSLEAFWLGKIAPEHVDAIEELLLRGLLHAPVFVPEFLGRESVAKRIEKLREGLPFDRLLELE